MNSAFLKQIRSGIRSIVAPWSRAGFPPHLHRADAGGVVTERLESRVHLTVSVSQNTTTNTLTITGDASANTIYVYSQNYSGVEKISVQADGNLSGPFVVDADLTLVKVNAGDGGDHVEFSNSSYAFTLNPPNLLDVSVPAEIHGEGGNDTVFATNQADTIWGDGGTDDLHGADGNDLMYGGYGSSTNHDNNADTLTGDPGADSMYGEDGNDTFHAGSDGAADFLDGGAGSDTATDRDAGDTTINIEIL